MSGSQLEALLVPPVEMFNMYFIPLRGSEIFHFTVLDDSHQIDVDAEKYMTPNPDINHSGESSPLIQE